MFIDLKASGSGPYAFPWETISKQHLSREFRHAEVRMMIQTTYGLVACARIEQRYRSRKMFHYRVYDWSALPHMNAFEVQGYCRSIEQARACTDELLTRAGFTLLKPRHLAML